MIRTNQRRLVTSHLLTDIHQRMDNLDAQFFALFRFRNGNILDMSGEGTRVNKLGFNEE